MPTSSSLPLAYKTPEYMECLTNPRYRFNVYEPEADTFLFLEALDTDAKLLRLLRPSRCVEIGSGSGTVVTHLACLLLSPSQRAVEEEGSRKVEAVAPHDARWMNFLAVDVNPIALEATGVTWTQTMQRYFTDGGERGTSSPCSVTQAPESASPTADAPEFLPDIRGPSCTLHRRLGDLFTGIPAEQTPFDVVLFNPPYVPTSMEELQDAVEKKDLITAAWCGGPRGRVVLDRFIEQLPSVLSPRGVCYVVLIKENDIEDVVAVVQQSFLKYRKQASMANGEKEVKTKGVASGGAAGADSNNIVDVVPIAQRYTGEHLSVYRISYCGALPLC